MTYSHLLKNPRAGFLYFFGYTHLPKNQHFANLDLLSFSFCAETFKVSWLFDLGWSSVVDRISHLCFFLSSEMSSPWTLFLNESQLVRSSNFQFQNFSWEFTVRLMPEGYPTCYFEINCEINWWPKLWTKFTLLLIFEQRGILFWGLSVHALQKRTIFSKWKDVGIYP